MLPPDVPTAQKDAAPALRRVSVMCWALIRPAWDSLRTTNREISTTLGISAGVHVALFLIVGTALYSSGEDDADVPELSVQLVTRQGPNSEEFTEAALPKPVPEPVEEELPNPGTSAAAASSTRAAKSLLPAGSHRGSSGSWLNAPPSLITGLPSRLSGFR